MAWLLLMQCSAYSAAAAAAEEKIHTGLTRVKKEYTPSYKHKPAT